MKLFNHLGLNESKEILSLSIVKVFKKNEVLQGMTELITV